VTPEVRLAFLFVVAGLVMGLAILLVQWREIRELQQQMQALTGEQAASGRHHGGDA
jgi:hypothetical protein